MQLYVYTFCRVSQGRHGLGGSACVDSSQGRIVRGIFARAFVQIGLGIAIGSGLAALFGLGSTRAILVLIGANMIMLIVGLASCAVPVRRALRIDPVEALRAEG